MRRTLLFVLSAALALPPLGLLAQTSPSYKNEGHVVNSGGNPAPTLTSTNYQVTLSSIGDGLTGTGMSSSGYTMDGGFVPDYPPPGEVLNLTFSDKTTLGWDPEASVGTYDVYRGTVAGLHGGSYGTCLAHGLTANQGTDTDVPIAGQCLTYLITAENRLYEEGTMGKDSSGATRPNTSPCP